MHIHTDIAFGGELRFAGMQTHAHAHLHTMWPGVGGETALGGHGSPDGIAGTGKGDEESIPLGIHFVTEIHLEGHAQEAATLHQHLGVIVTQLLEQLCRSLDIGEEQCYRSRGQVTHAGLPSPMPVVQCW